MDRNRRNIALLFAAYFLQGLVFYSPVATLYRQAAGVDILQIGIIESISMVLMLALEVPWGYWADRLGHRRTLVICSFLFALSKVIFWRAADFWGFLLERVVLAVCMSGLSGCDSAYLFACCTGDQEHRRVFSRWEAVQTAGLLCASLAWPLMGGDYRRSALLTVFSYTAAAGLTLLLREPEGARAAAGRGERPDFRAALRGTLALAPLLCGICLFKETVQMVTVFLGQLQFVRAGIPDGWFGALHAAVTVAGLAGGLSHRLTARLGERPAGCLLMGGAAAICLLLGLSPAPLLAVAGVVALRGLSALMNPLAVSLQNEQAPPAGRATQLSCNAMLMDLGAVCIYPAFGSLADAGVEKALLFGAFCCVLGLVFYYFGAKRLCQPGGDAA